MTFMKGNRLLIFASSWVLLFGVTVLIKWIGMDEAEASVNSSAEIYKGVVRKAQDARLASMPRITKSESRAVREVREFPELEELLRRGMLTSADAIQACVRRTMRGAQATERLEISFMTKRQNGSVRLTDLLLEKATANFDTSEVACFLEVVSRIDLGDSPEIDTRLSYPMCINKRPD